MKNLFNNYSKYISGNFLAISGYILTLLAFCCSLYYIVSFFSLSNEKTKVIDNLIGLFLISIPVIFSLYWLGLFLSLIEFIVRKAFKINISELQIFDECLPKEKLRIVLFWIGILAMNFAFPVIIFFLALSFVVLVAIIF